METKRNMILMLLLGYSMTAMVWVYNVVNLFVNHHVVLVRRSLGQLEITTLKNYYIFLRWILNLYQSSASVQKMNGNTPIWPPLRHLKVADSCSHGTSNFGLMFWPSWLYSFKRVAQQPEKRPRWWISLHNQNNLWYFGMSATTHIHQWHTHPIRNTFVSSR